MLNGLDDIDWSRLHHAYGPATDTPDHLRALASGDRKAQAEALGELWGSVYHQGTVYEASAYAAPFLVRLVAEKSLPGREEILCLLHGLATGSSYHVVHGDGTSEFATAVRAEPSFRKRVTDELKWVAATRDAVAQGLGLYLRLLHNNDPSLRLGAAHTLSAFPEMGGRIAPEIRAMAAREQDPLARAGAVLCLANLADTSSETVGFLKERLRASPNRAERLAAAVGLANSLGERASHKAVMELASAAADCWFVDECMTGVPWDFSPELRPETALAKIGPQAGAEAITSLIESLSSADKIVASFIIDALLAMAFGDADRMGRPLDSRSLNPQQRRVAQAIADADVVWANHGLFVSILDCYGLLPNPRQAHSGNWSDAREAMRQALAAG